MRERSTHLDARRNELESLLPALHHHAGSSTQLYHLRARRRQEEICQLRHKHGKNKLGELRTCRHGALPLAPGPTVFVGLHVHNGAHVDRCERYPSLPRAMIRGNLGSFLVLPIH